MSEGMKKGYPFHLETTGSNLRDLSLSSTWIITSAHTSF